jgi:hypothetical protein
MRSNLNCATVASLPCSIERVELLLQISNQSLELWLELCWNCVGTVLELCWNCVGTVLRIKPEYNMMCYTIPAVIKRCSSEARRDSSDSM